MSIRSSKFWIALTMLLTVILVVAVFAIMKNKYGMTSAVVSGLAVVVGMALYYIRGTLFSQSRKSSPPGRKQE